MHRLVVKATIAAGLALAPCAANAHSLTTLYSFTGGADGASPLAGVIDVDGTLYGTTSGGGASNAGAVFAVDPDTGAETVLYSFTGSPDGATPSAGLIEHGGAIYGTTRYGGQKNANRRGSGGVFAYNLDTNAAVFLSFKGHGHPTETTASLVYHGGKLYGTSPRGGTRFLGALFTASANLGHNPKSIYSFREASDGTAPHGALLDQGGLLYGTTSRGGAYDRGALFSFNPATGFETVLYDFGAQAGDGSNPQAALIYQNGILYGTTIGGGTSQQGTVFSFNLMSATEMVLHSFAGNSDGSVPNGGLLNKGTHLYGTTAKGGSANKGTVFKIKAPTRTEEILASFGARGNDGDEPEGTLISVNGNFYGTTVKGGSSGAGTVFRVNE